MAHTDKTTNEIIKEANEKQAEIDRLQQQAIEQAGQAGYSKAKQQEYGSDEFRERNKK